MNFRRYENEMKIVILVALYAILFAPILVGVKYLFPFVFPKAVYFQTLVEIAIILYVVLLAIDRKYLPRRTVILWGVAAYVLAIALSTVFGVDRPLSFWSKAERMDGLFQYLHLLAYFVILTGVVRKEEEWLRLLKVAMWAGVAIGTTALISKFFPDILNFGNQERLGATFGNPAFLGTHYVILSFIALTFFLREKAAAGRILYGSLFTFQFLLLFLSGTRGGYIGFIAGIFVLALVLAAIDWKRWGKLSLSIMALFFIVVAILYFGRNSLPQKSQFLHNRVYALADVLKLKGLEARVVSWKIAAEAFRAKPLFGWGQENYIYAFNTHFDPDIHTYELSLFDRAHNKPLDLLSMNGVPGLASYLFLFAAMAISMVGVMRRRVVSPIWPSGFLALVVAYFVQNLVLFEMPTSGIMLFFFAAFLSWMAAEVKSSVVKDYEVQPQQKQYVGSRPLFPEWVVVPTAAILLTAFYIGVWQPITAARAVVSTASALSNPNNTPETKVLQGLKVYKETRGKRSTFIDREFDVLIARRLRDAFPNPTQFASQNEDFVTFTEAIIEHLKQDFEAHPLDYDAMIEIGNLSFMLQGAKAEYTQKTFEALERARQIAPRREDAYQQLALWYLSVGDIKKADEFLDALLALNSKVGRFWWFRALYEATVNNPRGVDDALANARKYGYDWQSLGNLAYLVNSFERHKNWPEALKYYGVIARHFATSSFDIAIQGFDRALQIASSIGSQAAARELKAAMLELAGTKKDKIEEVATKYGF